MTQVHELAPHPAIIKAIIDECQDSKSFVLTMKDGTFMQSLPGQFVELSVPGYGEATFAITRLSKDYREFTVSIKRIGHLTRLLHRTSVNEIIGVRGPYGTPFPLENWHDKSLFIVAGGIGIAPLRPIIDHIRTARDLYGRLEILYGARTLSDIMYRNDLDDWEKDSSITLYKTIDVAHDDWKGRVGLVPQVLKELKPSPDNGIAVICGPPIMIKFAITTLLESGWKKQAIFTTLEMKMQCGIGQCGRCNIGEKFVCKDGPVFRLDQIPDFIQL